MNRRVAHVFHHLQSVGLIIPTNYMPAGLSGGGTVAIDPDRENLTLKLNKSQFVKLSELLLSFHAFLKYGACHPKDDKAVEAYHNSLTTMLSLITQGLQREDNTRQKNQDCHWTQSGS
jgi:hypothetical protein